jgi:hypothetical protein
MHAWTVDADDIRVADVFNVSLLHRTPEIDYICRHTLLPPRDLMSIGERLSTDSWLTGQPRPLGKLCRTSQMDRHAA